MKVQLVAKPGPGITGTSRYAENLYKGLGVAGIEVGLAFPNPVSLWPPAQEGFRRLGLDVGSFFASYPLRVQLGSANLYHITTQTLASLMMTQRFDGPVVVTVLDIIPYLTRHDRKLNTFRHALDYSMYSLSLAGLRRADALIAISEYTKHTLVEELRLPEGKIHVIFPQLDLALFRPQQVPDSFRARYGLADRRHILYVGTNDPRKNLPTLVRALGLLKQRDRDLRLIKVGSNPFARERETLQQLISDLQLQDDVLFFESVPDADLALFYNTCDLLVLPSFYEGFGIPVAEAMASGLPVVCSKTTALPEVAGDAAMFFEPERADALAVAIEQVLENSYLRESMRAQGIKQAAKFGQYDSIVPLKETYARVLG